jgi:hypothetical protein
MRALSRAGWIRLAAPARSFAIEDARDAMAMLAGPRRSGKLALVLDA